MLNVFRILLFSSAACLALTASAGAPDDIKGTELSAAITKASSAFIGQISKQKKSYFYLGQKIELTDREVAELYEEFANILNQSAEKPLDEQPPATFKNPFETDKMMVFRGLSIHYEFEVTVLQPIKGVSRGQMKQLSFIEGSWSKCPHILRLGDLEAQRLWIFSDEELMPGISVERYQTTKPSFWKK